MKVIVTKSVDDDVKRLINEYEQTGTAFRIISQAFMLTNPFRPDETNLYMTLQNSQQNHPLNYQDLPLAAEMKVEEIDGKLARFTRRGIKVAEATFLPGRFGQVADLKYYDRFGHINLLASYNIRGFLARRQFAGENGRIYLVEFLDATGTPAVTVNLTKVAGVSKTIWRREATNQVYDSELAMFADFVREQISPDDEVVIAASLAGLTI